MSAPRMSRGEDVSPRERQRLLLERQKRIDDAVGLRKPDRVPIACMWDFFPARRRGYTVKEVMQDPQLLFDVWIDCLEHFSPDIGDNPFARRGFARVLEALDYQGLLWAGHGLGENQSYQFVEIEVMKEDEYDHFLFDPSDFMMRRFWPRVNKALAPLADLPPLSQIIPYFWGLFSPAALLTPDMERARAALIEAGRASAVVMEWATKYRNKMLELGFPEPAGGFTQVPFDTLGDMFRGTRGILTDLYRRPDKVMAACEKLLPLMIDSALASVRRSGVPRVFIPLHKGLDKFLSAKQFERFYLPHLKELLDALIREGISPWVFAEGVCNTRLEAFADVPPGKVVYQFEATDIFLAKKVMRGRCCIKGNVPASLLAIGSPDEVTEYCRRLIRECAMDGGLIVDASAPMADARPENVQAMFDATRRYGAEI